MAEVLLTYEQNPPFAASAILSPSERIDLTGPDSVERVILEAPPVVLEAVGAALDAASEEKAGRLMPQFNYLHELVEIMADEAASDRSVADTLVLTTPTEARRLGAFVAATTIATGMKEERLIQKRNTEDRLRSMAIKLQTDQSAYEPADRERVRREAGTIFEDPGKSERIVAGIVQELAAETAEMTLPEAARNALAFFDGVVIVGDRNSMMQIEAAPGTSYPPEPDELLTAAPEFVAKIVAAVETGSGEVEKSQLKQYTDGMRRALAYVSLVIAKTATSPQSQA